MTRPQRRDWPIAALALILGVTIIACTIESGRHRWEDPAWYYASLVPGSPMSWGLLIAAGGLLIILGAWSKPVRALGYWIVFAWFCLMAGASTLSAWKDLISGTREADPVDIICWSALAYWCRSCFPARH